MIIYGDMERIVARAKVSEDIYEGVIVMYKGTNMMVCHPTYMFI